MTLLLYAGGFTTSIEAGMAFLDWPLSNGSLNPEGWIQASDQFAEHSHRLLGMKMGLLSIAMALFCWIFESRKEVRYLAIALVLIIVFQGILGGMRVLFDQQNTQSDSNWIAQVFLILHACGAQITLCTLVTLVLLLSKQWINGRTEASGLDSIFLQRWSKMAVVTLFAQLLLGALVRHFKAAAIFGNNFPLLTEDFIGWSSLFPLKVTLYTMVHYLHRLGAVVVTFVILRFLVRSWSFSFIRKYHGFWITMLSGLLALQIFLGALIVWTLRNPYVATIHTLCGASILAITWALTVCFHRSNPKEIS